MQPLTAAPREGLTAAQVIALLTGPALHVSAGCELLRADLTIADDISDDLVSGSVEWAQDSMLACKLRIDRALSWGTDLVRPYMTLTDDAVSARFNIGVFSLTTPVRTVGDSVEGYDCSGFDRLYLLNRPVGDTHAVASGTGYLAAVASVIAAAGLVGVSLDSTAAAKTLPVDQVWPILSQSGGTTWLQVANDLLAAVGYRPLWTDENGLFRSEPNTNPTARAPEFSFDTGSATIVGEQRTFQQDIWATPNRWVFIQQNRNQASGAATEGAGIYTVNNLDDGITSQNARGLVWPKVVQVDAADQATLVARGDLVVAADLRVTTALQVTTGPFPVAGRRDVFAYDDSVLGSMKVQASRWSMDLSGADVSWTWQVV